MSKTKCYVLGSIFLCLVVVIAMASIRPAKADTTTTFPVDEAGIAAYVKLDSVDATVLTRAGHTVEKQGESYVIVTVNVPESSYPPHVYIGLDGWIVAYYLKEEEASRIMQWRGYTPGTINTTTLKDAIDIICEQTGVSYSTPIKYYDFEFPEANKMTLVAEEGEGSNDFYVTVPGTLFEASYEVLLKSPCCSGWGCKFLKLIVGENLVYESPGLGCVWICSSPFYSYGYYDLSIFETGITHHVILSTECDNSATAYATLLIYKN